LKKIEVPPGSFLSPNILATPILYPKGYPR
jgi:hypothetical protein